MEPTPGRSTSPGVRLPSSMAYELPIARSIWPKVVGTVLVAVMVIFILSLVATRHLIDPGIDDFRQDPLAHAVAKEAYATAWIHRDNPLQRLFAPAAKVVRVERRPGHCKSQRDTSASAPSRMPPPEPGVRLRADPGVASGPSWAEWREYVASVRFYTSFGIPVATVNVTCERASYEPLP